MIQFNKVLSCFQDTARKPLYFARILPQERRLIAILRIAICDDEPEQIQQIQRLLGVWVDQHPELQPQVTAFLSGTALLEHISSKGTFDIYLLDVLFPGTNGIDLGLKIRDTDQEGHIFYLTNSRDHAVDSYLTRAFQYLLKPIDRQRFYTALDQAAHNWLREHTSFITVKTRNGLQRLSIRNIVYGELVGHCVQYHLADSTALESTTLRTSFREAVAPLLKYDRFALCGTSFFVNLSFVTTIDSNGLKLTTGKTLPLSRTLRTEVTNKWLDYYLKEC